MFSDQSCVNRTEPVHGTSRFLFFTLTYCKCMECVKIFIMNRYISKSYATIKNTTDDNIQSGGSCSVNYYLSRYSASYR